MRFGELLKQCLMGGAKRFKRCQLEYRLHLAFEQHRQHDNAAWRRAAQPGANLRIFVRHIGKQNLLTLNRTLPHQAFA